MRQLLLFPIVGFLLGSRMPYREVLQPSSTLTWTATIANESRSGTVRFGSGFLERIDGYVVGGRFEVLLKTLAKNSDVNGDFRQMLLQNDYLEVKKFPVAVYQIDSATVLASLQTRLFGRLSLHGETHPLEIDAELHATPAVTVLQANFELRLPDWGIAFTIPNGPNAGALLGNVRIKVVAQFKPA